MNKSLRQLLAVCSIGVLAGLANSPAWASDEVPSVYNIGQAATASEIERWNTDVKPNGEGLPEGKGSVADGKLLYDLKCKTCHGENGIGGPFGSLVSTDPKNTFDFGTNPHAVKTIGNYWPYATTLFDYIQRAMPFEQPGSLTANEVYGLVAYLLNENKIVPADSVIDKTNLPKVKMPARDRFVPDHRSGGKEVL